MTPAAGDALGDADGPDFFISYTGADEAWASWIAQQLEDTAYRVLIQTWDFRPGQDFLELMDRGVRQADRLLIVLSPAYLASAYARAEWKAVFHRDILGDRGLLIPVRIAPCEPEGLLKGRVWIDLVGLDAEAARARLLAGVEQGRAKPFDPVTYPGPSSPTALGGRGRVWNIPPPVRTFTGRTQDLVNLHCHLTDRGRAALVPAAAVWGMGGIGKTQLARAFAHTYRDDYELGWWIPAGSVLEATTALAELAVRLGAPTGLPPDQLVAYAHQALADRVRWLLVFDNAAAPEDLEGLLPAAGDGQVLLTSRTDAWDGFADPVALDVLPLEEATELLLVRTGCRGQPGGADQSGRRPAARQLAEALGGLPLALEQAAAYTVQQHLTLPAYLALFGQKRDELLARGTPLAYDGTVDTVTTLTAELLARTNPAAEWLLEVCALLAPDQLPVDQLLEDVDRLPGLVQAEATDPLTRTELVGALYRAAILVEDTTLHTAPDAGSGARPQTARLHRLTQALIVAHLNDAARVKRLAETTTLLAGLFPDNAWDVPAAWPACTRLVPHIKALGGHAATAKHATLELAWLLTATGHYVLLRGLGAAIARDLHQQAFAMFERLHGPGTDHPDVARSLYYLAGDLRALGERAQSRALNERALAMLERLCGPDADDPDLARSLHFLAVDVHESGKPEQARELNERALAIRERLHRRDNSASGSSQRQAPDPTGTDSRRDLAWSLTNLANNLRVLGKPERARELDERALAIRKQVYGADADHPHIAWSMANLAADLLALGEPRQARELDEQALAMRQRLYGADTDHAHIAWSLTMLADDLRALGEFKRAQDLDERALAMRARLANTASR